MAVRRVVPDLLVEDTAVARKFYEEVLDLDVVMDMGWLMTFAAPGDTSTQLTVMTHDATAPVSPDVSIEVDDVDEVHAAAERAGYEIIHPLTDEPWGVRRFFVRAPGGRVLNVLQHR